MIIIDTIGKTVTEEVNFREWVPALPIRFAIFRFVPLGNNGIRILLQDNGGFSFIWRSIARRGEVDSIFVGAKVDTLFLGLRGQITTPFTVASSFGVSQLVFNDSLDGFKIAFVRVYSSFNHKRSKIFKEYRIGKVDKCDTMSSPYNNPTLIILICSSRIYVLDINLNPDLEIVTDGRKNTLDLTLEAYNEFSSSEIRVIVENTGINTVVSPWVVFVIFLLIILTGTILYHVITKIGFKPLRKKKSPALLNSKSNAHKACTTPDYLVPPQSVMKD